MTTKQNDAAAMTQEQLAGVSEGRTSGITGSRHQSSSVGQTERGTPSMTTQEKQ